MPYTAQKHNSEMFSRLVTLVSASVEAKTRFEWGNGGVVVAGCACMNYISETITMATVLKNTVFIWASRTSVASQSAVSGY